MIGEGIIGYAGSYSKFASGNGTEQWLSFSINGRDRINDWNLDLY